MYRSVLMIIVKIISTFHILKKILSISSSFTYINYLLPLKRSIYIKSTNIPFSSYFASFASPKEKLSFDLWARGFLPGSVGGLQAPTNWIRSSLTNCCSPPVPLNIKGI